MHYPELLFIILYWPCIRLGQVLHRLSKGQQLGSEQGTVIGLGFLTDIPYWLIYISVIIHAL
jgi:hypothetical protein